MAGSEKGGYVRPELLVETDWLEDHLDDPGLRIVDCDLPEAYNRVHIPGAVSVPDHYYKDPDTDRVHVMKPHQIAELMGSLGIGNDTLVVAYDTRGGVYAARLWWVLNYYGHTRVKVLNGGWRKWLREKRRMTDEVPRHVGVPGATFVPRENRSLLATREDVLEGLSKEGHLVWDVRSREEYTGEERRGNKRRGHLKGAVHLEWVNTVNKDGTFKSGQELRQIMDSLGVTPEKTVTTH